MIELGDHIVTPDGTSGTVIFISQEYLTLQMDGERDPDNQTGLNFTLHDYSKKSFAHPLIYRSVWNECTITKRTNSSTTPSDDEG
tara:strand:+ start:31504 stop:31758 length:255 start_codon:yes stop_codon:yes gene_type:complete